MLGERRARRHGEEGEEPVELAGRLGDELAIPPHHLGGVLERPEHRAGVVGVDGCALKRNDVTTPKLPPPPRTAQKRSAFSLALAVTNCPSASTMSTASRLSIVRPHCRVRWPMPPPSVRPPTPVVEMMPAGTARPNACVGMVDVAPQRAAAGEHGVLLRVDADVPHRRQIDDQAVVAHAQAAGVVAAAADRHQQLVLAAEVHRRDDVGDVGAAGDQARPPVDHPVVDLAGLVVLGVAGAMNSPRRLALNVARAVSVMHSLRIVRSG